MDQERQVELQIHTTDENVLKQIEDWLPSTVTSVRGEPSRSLTIATILLTATAAVKLTTALIELRDKYQASKHKLPKVELRNAIDGSVDLIDAMDNVIKELVDAGN